MRKKYEELGDYFINGLSVIADAFGVTSISPQILLKNLSQAALDN